MLPPTTAEFRPGNRSWDCSASPAPPDRWDIGLRSLSLSVSLSLSPNNKSVLPSRRLAKWPLALSCSLSPPSHYCPAPLPIPKYECIARPKGRLPPPARAALHAMNATISWRMSAKTRQGQKTSPSCSIGYVGEGATRFSCEQSGAEDRGDSRLCGQVGTALGRWRWRRRRRGGRSLCFIIKAAKTLPLFAMRCAEPMDGCRSPLPPLFVLSPSWNSQRSSKSSKGIPQIMILICGEWRHIYLPCVRAGFRASPLPRSAAIYVAGRRNKHFYSLLDGR